MPYTVTLADYSVGGDVPEVVSGAVGRFRREIDRQLGDGADTALRAFLAASEGGAEDLSKAETTLATTWAKAYGAAKDAGLRGLGQADEAWFDVRPA